MIGSFGKKGFSLMIVEHIRILSSLQPATRVNRTL